MRSQRLGLRAWSAPALQKVNVVPQRSGSRSSASPLLAKHLELVGAHEGEQALLEGARELQRQAQTGGPGEARVRVKGRLRIPAEPTSSRGASGADQGLRIEISGCEIRVAPRCRRGCAGTS
jgi:hypothetical protein